MKKIFVCIVFALVSCLSCVNVFAAPVVEKLADDPLAEEIYELADEIADAVNTALEPEALCDAGMIDFSRTYKVYNGLFYEIIDEDITASEYKNILNGAGYSWAVIVEHERDTVIVFLKLGEGINPNGGYADIVNGEREGTPEELADIALIQAREGHFYVSSFWKTDFTFYEDMKNGGFDGEIYFMGMDAAMLVRGDELFVNFSGTEGIGAKSVAEYFDADDYENGFIPFADVSDTYLDVYSVEVPSEVQNVSEGGPAVGGMNDVSGDAAVSATNDISIEICIAAALGVISLIGIIILFATKKNKA